MVELNISTPEYLPGSLSGEPQKIPAAGTKSRGDVLRLMGRALLLLSPCLISLDAAYAQFPPAAGAAGSQPVVIRGQSADDVDPAFSGFSSPGSSRPSSSQQTRPVKTVSADSPADSPASQPRRLADVPTSAPDRSIESELLTPPTRTPHRASALSMGLEEQRKPRHDESLLDVRFEGNATIPVATMSRYIKSRPGRPTTDDQVREDMRSLYNTKWFFSIEPVYRQEAGGWILVYKVTERPILQNVEYRGNEKIKDHVLAGLTGLKPLHAFSVATNREAARRIKEHYEDKGFLFAEVSLLEGDRPEDRSVIFQISEGPKVQVSAVKFRGNENVSSELLKLQLATKKRILWKFGGQYNSENIAQDIASIKEYYHNIGYFDVQITDNVEFSTDRATVTVNYTIDEGMRYKIRHLHISGNQIFSREQLVKDFKVTEGSYYSARQLYKDIGSVQQKYGELGHLFAKVEHRPVFTQEPGIVDLKLDIDEDRVRKIGMVKVHIRGEHSHTKETVALNQLLVAPGDLADPEKIRRSKARLAGSPIWEGGGPDAPQINMRPVSDPTYLAKNTGLDDLIVRGSSGYFGHEKPLNVDSLNLPASVKQAMTPTEFVPTTHREVRGTAFENSGGTPGGPVPGGGHTLQRTIPTTPPVPVKEDAPRIYRQERQPREEVVEEAELYQLIDMNQTQVFVDQAEDTLLLPLHEKKAEEPVVRAQNFDNYTSPPNLMYSETPQGDLLGPQLPSPVVPPGYVDLDVYLSEARTGRFMIGAGVNSDSGVVGNVVLEEQNFDILRFPRSFRDVADGYAFRGGGQQFRLEATPGSEVSRYMVSWTDPYFLNSDYSLGVSGFFYQRFFRDWNEERLGGRINVGKLLTRELSFNTALRLENVDISRPRLPPGAAPSIDAMLGDNFLGTGRFTLGYDTRDSSYMATEGFNVSGSVEQAFGDYDFTKLELQGSQYYTVYQRADGAGRHVLSLRGNLGWTTNDTPAFERFYAGGFQSFRGFEFRSVSPLEPGNVGTNGAAVGGFFQMLGTVEYMLPVMANEAVRLVAFSDFGTVDEDVSLDKFRLSVGTGLRITVPQMGPVPIALDWAFPVVKEDSDIRQIFSFYIGITR